MQLTLEQPNFEFFMRGANGRHACVNSRVLHHSFVITPSTLLETWPVTHVAELKATDFDLLLAQQPELILLGSGETQVFMPTDLTAALLTRGIGVEVMANAAAARIFNVLAGEGRRVVAGFVIS